MHRVDEDSRKNVCWDESSTDVRIHGTVPRKTTEAAEGRGNSARDECWLVIVHNCEIILQCRVRPSCGFGSCTGSPSSVGTEWDAEGK